MLRAGTRFLCAGLVMGLSLAAAAQSQPAPETPKVTEFYVRYQAAPRGSPLPEALLGIQRATALSVTAGVPLAYVRTLRDGAHVVRSDHVLTRAQAWALARTWPIRKVSSSCNRSIRSSTRARRLGRPRA